MPRSVGHANRHPVHALPITFFSFQADCARFSVERGVDVDRLFPHRWNIDQAGEAYQLFDRQVDGKGVFLM